ncbi:MAG: hypothetical protein ACKOXJ_02300 [Alphaproteobacteria bacterium]
MEFLNNFFKSGFVRIVIFILFLFMVYEQSKDDPRSFSNTLKNQDIKKNIANLKNNFEMIKKVKEEGLVDYQNESVPQDEFADLSFKVVRQGLMDNPAQCNDEVNIEYIFMSESGNIVNKSIIKIIVGENFNKIVEKTLIGMVPGEIRQVLIPKNFKTGDAKYDNYIQSRNMVYQIMLIQVNKSIANNYMCN